MSEDEVPWQQAESYQFADWLIRTWLNKYDESRAPRLDYDHIRLLRMHIAMTLDEYGIELPKKRPEGVRW